MCLFFFKYTISSLNSNCYKINRSSSPPSNQTQLRPWKKLGFFPFATPLPMDRLRPRERSVFSGFTTAELQKLENLFEEYGVQTLNREFCQRTAVSFSRSAGRKGKPIVKADDIQSWFQNKQRDCPAKVNPPVTQQGEATPSHVISKALAADLNACIEREANGSNQDQKAEQVSKGEEVPGLSQLEFEAKSSKDAAWYDVDRLLTHRFTGTGEAEVRVRFVGFGAEDDEWVNVKKCVRERSVPFEHWECNRVKVGDVVLCLQESEDQAIYYDAHVVEIQQKMHDIRGCRCIFLVRYNHDNTEEKVRLRRLCRILVHPLRN